MNSIWTSLSELALLKNCSVKPVNLLGGGVSQSTWFNNDKLGDFKSVVISIQETVESAKKLDVVCDKVLLSQLNALLRKVDVIFGRNENNQEMRDLDNAALYSMMGQISGLFNCLFK